MIFTKDNPNFRSLNFNYYIPIQTNGRTKPQSNATETKQTQHLRR